MLVKNILISLTKISPIIPNAISPVFSDISEEIESSASCSFSFMLSVLSNFPSIRFLKKVLIPSRRFLNSVREVKAFKKGYTIAAVSPAVIRSIISL